MRVLIYLLPFILMGITFYVGYTVGRSKPKLSRWERKHLDAYDRLFDDLSVKAAEHSMLGDDFAVIVAGDIAAHRKAISS